MLINATVADNELLARYIVFGSWIRKDNTVKPDAFIPHPYPNLSVTRHFGLSEKQLWNIGRDIAKKRPDSVTLKGRADVDASVVKRQNLTIISDPDPENSNHANITGWPAEKHDQKIKALVIAAEAQFVPIKQQFAFWKRLIDLVRKIMRGNII